MAVVGVSLTFCARIATGADPAADCAAIEAAEERLACFDAAFQAEPPPAPEEPVPAATGPEPDAGAAAAGAAATAGSAGDDFGVKKSRDETEGSMQVAAISKVGKDGYGKLYFELDNGQVWRQIEYERFPAKAGDVAEIRPRFVQLVQDVDPGQEDHYARAAGAISLKKRGQTRRSDP